jgi:hypothetical protein
MDRAFDTLYIRDVLGVVNISERSGGVTKLIIPCGKRHREKPVLTGVSSPAKQEKDTSGIS